MDRRRCGFIADTRGHRWKLLDNADVLLNHSTAIVFVAYKALPILPTIRKKRLLFKNWSVQFTLIKSVSD